MAPPSWATKEEQDFLTSNLPEYEACQVKRRYKSFWQRLNRDYFERFPVVDKLFPGLEVSQLDEEQKAQVSSAVVKQQKRLKEWFRWQTNPRSRHASSKEAQHPICNGRTRVLQPYEVFAKLYPEKVAEAKEKQCEEKSITGRERFKVWREVARELYERATEEQLEAVDAEMKTLQKGVRVRFIFV